MEKAWSYASRVSVLGSEGLPIHHSQGPTLELHSPSSLCVLAMFSRPDAMSEPSEFFTDLGTLKNIFLHATESIQNTNGREKRFRTDLKNRFAISQRSLEETATLLGLMRDLRAKMVSARSTLFLIMRRRIKGCFQRFLGDRRRRGLGSNVARAMSQYAEVK